MILSIIDLTHLSFFCLQSRFPHQNHVLYAKSFNLFGYVLVNLIWFVACQQFESGLGLRLGLELGLGLGLGAGSGSRSGLEWESYFRRSKLIGVRIVSSSSRNRRRSRYCKIKRDEKYFVSFFFLPLYVPYRSPTHYPLRSV